MELVANNKVVNHTKDATTNVLYPIFLKLHKLNMLIVGAGEVGHEKLSFILKSSPNANVKMVAPWVSDKVKELLIKYPENRVEIVKRPFEKSDVLGANLVIAATDIEDLNAEVQAAANAQNILVNVADTPDRCDFYLGAIVTRGPLKVAISTNGQSPTFAKRFRQMLEEAIPIETTDLLAHLRKIRQRLTGDFQYKVKELNNITASLLEKNKN